MSRGWMSRGWILSRLRVAGIGKVEARRARRLLADGKRTATTVSP